MNAADKRNFTQISASALVALALVAAAACGGAAAQPEHAEVKTEASALAVQVVKAQTATLESAIEISGNLAPQTRVGIMSKLGGTLDRVLVDLGDRVSEGTVVATLDRREIDAQVDAAAAAVAVAKAAQEAAEASQANAAKEIERARNLFEQGAIAKAQLDAAETAHRTTSAQRELSKANVAQAEASLRRAREVQRDATLRSPISGVVVERNFDAGSLVGPGDKPVVAVADNRVLKLEAGVSELEAGRLKAGTPATIKVTALPGRTFEGKIVALAPEIDLKNRHFRIDVRVMNTDGALLGGMYAVARVVTARAESAVVVPRDAIFQRGGQRMVYVVSGERATATPVKEGLTDGTRVQLVSGVAAGATIVADARRDIAEGVKIRPMPAAN
ncbi:MAG TPA: efflux RND transporter periplasmic adaptor subunit [Vicinamibacterales bacterium]|nr:efflux RND transporter periplasmic adaptor subunit [Vicinamibacterales bacterium]